MRALSLSLSYYSHESQSSARLSIYHVNSRYIVYFTVYGHIEVTAKLTTANIDLCCVAIFGSVKYRDLLSINILFILFTVMYRSLHYTQIYIVWKNLDMSNIVMYCLSKFFLYFSHIVIFHCTSKRHKVRAQCVRKGSKNAETVVFDQLGDRVGGQPKPHP